MAAASAYAGTRIAIVLGHVTVEKLEKRLGRRIPMNLDGVGAAIILDLGLPWRSARIGISRHRTWEPTPR